MQTNAERTHTAVPRPEPGTKAAAKRELQLRSLPENLQPKRVRRRSHAQQCKGLVAAEGKSEGEQSGVSKGPELNPDGAERSRFGGEPEREPGWATELEKRAQVIWLCAAGAGSRSERTSEAD